MKRNRIPKIVLTCLALNLLLVSFGCQPTPPSNEIAPQEDEMQENQPQTSNEINSGSIQKEIATSEASESLTFEEKTIFIGPEKAECVGVGPMECYLLKENPEDEWQYFYNSIQGFEWEAGYTYELRVAIYPVENPPADASSLRYELLEVVNKTETPSETRTVMPYIHIEEPAAGSELDASKAILVRGMGGALFEGNVVVQILDEAGNELALQPTIIQSPEAGTGGEGPWQTEIKIAIEDATAAKILAFSTSPKDGSVVASDEIAVALNPGMAFEASIEDTPWTLWAFAQQAELDDLLAFNQVSALFNSQDSTISGSTGCNRYFSSYTLEGSQVSLDPVATTRMACPEPQAMLEQAYLEALEKVAGYQMVCNAMQLLDTEGNVLLVYRVDPYSLSETFSWEELANTTFLNEFAKSGIVQLTNGMYREPIVEGSATELVVMLTNQAAFGDVTGDGGEDAVVVLVSQPGGSGSFYDLAVVQKQDETLTNLAHIQLGDRIETKSLLIENGEIVVDMITQGPEDAMCCPTQYVSNRYILENGELVLVRSDVIE
ncbi:MAG: DUF4377 domain-containing protein [Anaerolineales bacterium]